MTAVEAYRVALRSLEEWDTFLLEHSGLPGPRANLELAHAVSMEGSAEHFWRYIALGPEMAPTNTPQVLLVVCGVLGLGRLLAGGEAFVLAELRRVASDPRWRVREAVAMALQTWGDSDMSALLDAMLFWSDGTLLEQRAAAAALAEPRLLRRTEHAERVLDILDAITTSVVSRSERKTEDFRILRQGLGYCWSVAVAALPDVGRGRMERWLRSSDPDVRWIMRENLRKKRLARLDPEWVRRGLEALGT